MHNTGSQRSRRALHRLLVSLLGIALFATQAIASDSIMLRPVARVSPDEAITLSMVAVLTGPEAQALGTVELAPAGRHPSRLTIEDVRQAIGTDRTIHWGRLSLAGNDCRIITLHPSEGPEEVSESQALVATRPQPTGPTVRDAVIARIHTHLGLPAERVRIEFEDREAAIDLLDHASIGRTIEVRPIGTSDRLPLSITIYENHWIVARGIVRADLQILKEVALTREVLSRGTTLTSEHIRAESRWVRPSARLATPEQAIGAVLRARVNEETPLTTQDVQPPIVIKRGDHAIVHCLSGGIVMKLRARAMEDGRIGDEIEFTGLEGRKGRAFVARVDGPGVAIIAADETPLPSSLTTLLPPGETR
ncbi:flagellar basal body P-ring formation chaperone FlgA [Nodularia spumigena]|uniref:flagellar basal body P-ring formation chaperone FlgA n=1 Tax=Nodularia spumigena TaxID=70799 RepID=UPI002B20AC87|nr:flagellar basal body P-ring formation chaperone FlgA [Nodularia spumigena]MEA5557603.1 flagellar basal body P-ring formation chaperone FlgA [Nodularia spumigena CH309]